MLNEYAQATAMLLGSIEALKTQRDLYLAFRDLFVRHDREYHENSARDGD